MNTTEISKEAREASEREIEASMGMRVGQQGCFVQQAILAATAELRKERDELRERLSWFPAPDSKL